MQKRTDLIGNKSCRAAVAFPCEMSLLLIREWVLSAIDLPDDTAKATRPHLSSIAEVTLGTK